MAETSTSKRSDPFRRQSRRVGWGMIGLAAAIPPLGLCLLCFVLLPLVDIKVHQLGSGGLQGIAAILIAISALLVMASRKHFSRPAETVLAEDARRPVLFLRQFDEDRRNAADIAFVGPYASSFEERIARALKGIGPVVAIGRPSDRLPPPGAARMYVSDEAWQAQVLDLIRRCSAIVLQTGDTPGIRWEIEQVIREGDPSRLILILPWQDNRLDRDRYHRFLAGNGDLFPKRLPDVPNAARFMSFSKDWTPRPLQCAPDGIAAVLLGTNAEEGASLSATARIFVFGVLIVFGSLLAYILYGWAAEEAKRSTWMGLYPSQAQVLAAHRPRLETIAGILQRAAARADAPLIEPQAPIEPSPRYGTADIDPNTDIVTVSEIEHLAGVKERVDIQRSLSQYLMEASAWAQDRHMRLTGYRPDPETERTLSIASRLTYVVVVRRGTTRVDNADAPRLRIVSETIRLSLVRLADEAILASRNLHLSQKFGELEGYKRLRRSGDPHDTIESNVLWDAGRQKIAAALEALTGGRFDPDAALVRARPSASNASR